MTTDDEKYWLRSCAMSVKLVHQLKREGLPAETLMAVEMTLRDIRHTARVSGVAFGTVALRGALDRTRAEYKEQRDAVILEELSG